jgi:hypothetical protein
MQSTLTERATPYQPTQRALQFALLFGASGRVARPDLHPTPLTKRNCADDVITRRLRPGRDHSHLCNALHSTIKSPTTLNCCHESES